MKKKEEITIRSSAAEYLTYVASVGEQQDSIEMRYEDENIWLTQKMMAQLYDVSVQNIGQHIKKIYEDRELIQEATIKKFFIVQNEGGRQVNRGVTHYNLQMIIAVGFKVNSERAVQFRKWVNQIAKDYTIKGWVMDDERLKRGTYLTEKYFTMEDWEKRLNSFIEMFDYGILKDAGKVSAEIAKLHAETEFEKYRIIQDRLFMSDFDKYMLELEETVKG